MKDLSTFVKDAFLKNHLFDEGVYISTIEEADKMISEVSYGRYVNIVFEHSGIKDYFINNLYQKSLLDILPFLSYNKIYTLSGALCPTRYRGRLAPPHFTRIRKVKETKNEKNYLYAARSPSHPRRSPPTRHRRRIGGIRL